MPERIRIRVTAAIIFNEDNRILIARKKPGKPMAGYWEFPGGKLEQGESPEQCINREILEELNIALHGTKPYCTYDFTTPGKDFEFLFFTATGNTGTIRLTDHDAIAWVLPEEITEYNIAPADQIAVAYIRENGFDLNE